MLLSSWLELFLLLETKNIPTHLVSHILFAQCASLGGLGEGKCTGKGREGQGRQGLVEAKLGKPLSRGNW